MLFGLQIIGYMLTNKEVQQNFETQKLSITLSVKIHMKRNNIKINTMMKINKRDMNK